MTTDRLRVWCVSDGRAGIARQCAAVANALSDLTAIDKRDLTLTPHTAQAWLPPAFWPAPLAALPKEQRAALSPPWPDIWIANGRRSIAYSLWMKTHSPSFVVQLQDPRVDPARFDLVVPPRHDGVVGRNVVETLGAPVWFTQSQIEAAIAQHPVPKLEAGPIVLVILGGTSKRHQFTESRGLQLIADLQTLAAKGARLLITTSRRTPPEVENLFRAAATKLAGAHFFANEAQDGANPYLAWLAQADHAMVTEDSTNMMTDAAFFGLPIHLLRLSGGDARFDRMHRAFIDRGAARWFEGTLDTWHYPPVKDACDVAQAILARLTNVAV